MKRLDLIIDSLELARKSTDEFTALSQINKALSAARELRDVSTKQQNVNTSEERVQKSDEYIHEPVAEVVSDHHAGMYEVLPLGTLLYTSPPRKEWVSLTDAVATPLIEKAAKYYGYENKPIQTAGFFVLAQEIEAKLKEKNS